MDRPDRLRPKIIVQVTGGRKVLAEVLLTNSTAELQTRPVEERRWNVQSDEGDEILK